jgi:hypothetical protein
VTAMLEMGPPSTLAGARAFVQHFATIVADECLPQPRELVEYLVRSPLFAA